MLICVTLALVLLPTAAHAAAFTVTDGQTFDFATECVAAGDVITVASGATATLVGASGATYTNVQISCGAGTDLTLSNVNIDNSGCAANTPLLIFTGSGNKLTLADGTTSNLTGAPNAQGIAVCSGTALEIYGPGTLNVTSNVSSAIGGGSVGGLSDAGTITINGGTIYARVTTTLFACGAAIGDATSGGVSTPSGCIININGGTVTAICDYVGPGIGGSGATVNITGGTVYASGDSAHDIGNTNPAFYSGPDTTLSISGEAAVFLRNDRSVAPTTATHTHQNVTGHTAGEDAYGIAVPWDGDFGAWLVSNTGGATTRVTAGTTNLYVGGRTTLTPQVPGGKWIYDDSMAALTQNADGTITVKALKAGNTTLHYTVGYADADIALTILDRSLPQTGQDYMPLYLLLILAGCAAVTAVICKKRKVIH